MKKIFEGPTRRVGTIFTEVDSNFIEVLNGIMRIAFPDYTLLGYAETEPVSPTLFDCYLVKEDATIWEIVCEKNEIISWTGIDWELLPYKVTEINQALQFLYFDAANIAVSPIEGLTSSDVQAVLNQLTASIIAHGIVIVPEPGSGGSTSL